MDLLFCVHGAGVHSVACGLSSERVAAGQVDPSVGRSQSTPPMDSPSDGVRVAGNGGRLMSAVDKGLVATIAIEIRSKSPHRLGLEAWLWEGGQGSARVLSMGPLSRRDGVQHGFLASVPPLHAAERAR
jgi:hypothetical protein